MAVIGYPVFEGGMTLTKDDLNLLREFFDVQDSVLGRLVGFGVACGLDGQVKGTTLRIGTGLAIDQNGRGLVLDTPVTLGPGAVPGATFSFVDRAAKGVTPVLVFREVDEKAPECGDETCEPHAPLRLRSAEVVLAIGRLRLGSEDFAADPLLKLSPLTVDQKGNVKGDLAKLRDAILRRLDDAGVVLSAAGRALLAGLSPDGIPGVRVYRASYLNEVLFAAIELMRCRTLQAAPCLREETTPGVALGWLSPQGEWHCAYRHEFSPTEGLAAALLGGGCGDPCALQLDRLEAVLASYVEPPAPKPSDPPLEPPKLPDFELCPPQKRYGPLLFDNCQITVIPDWIDPKKLKDSLVKPEPVPGFGRRPVEDLGLPELDYHKAGTFGLTKVLGTEAAGARDVLLQLLGNHLEHPEVVLTTPEALAGLKSFEPQVNIGVGDTPVLVADALGKVILTGRISAQQTAINAGGAIDEAKTTAVAAVAEAKGIADVLRTNVEGSIGALRAKVTTDLAGLTREFAATKLAVETAQRSLEGALTERLDNIALTAGRSAPSFSVQPQVAEVRKEELLALVGSMEEAVVAAAAPRQREAVTAKFTAARTAVEGMGTDAGGVVARGGEATALVTALTRITEATGEAGAKRETVNVLNDDIQRLLRPR